MSNDAKHEAEAAKESRLKLRLEVERKELLVKGMARLRRNHPYNYQHSDVVERVTKGTSWFTDGGAGSTTGDGIPHALHYNTGYACG